MNEETNDILLRIEQLLKGLLRTAVSKKLDEINADNTLRVIWDLTGGGTPVTQIAKKAKVSPWKVSTIWQSWQESGLVVKAGKSYQKTIA
ncbi:MAG: hypothetical protein ABSC21_20790 [Terriglobia bacterium]|jgi:Mn-dependent DtxR family transcriptional regulator